MQQIQVQYLPFKLGTVCQHDISKANSNYIDISCTRKPETYHRISQASKICNKCATLIMNSANSTQDCSCCNQKLQQLLSSSWICSHKDRNIDQIIIKCLNNQKQTHQVPFQSKVCQLCLDKIRASFMFASSCAVCDQKQNNLLENIQKTITQPSYYFFNEVVKEIKNKKLNEEEIKNQIQNFCIAQPHNSEIKSKFIQQMKLYADNHVKQHQSKRYQLYPKCAKHRNNYINLCNNCLVSILNLKCCPYGCSYQKKEGKIAKVQQFFSTQTGFLCLYPKQAKDYQYIQYFVIRYKQETNKLDKWQASLKKIKYLGNQNILPKFGLYSAGVQVSKLNFFYSGGVIGSSLSTMKPTNQCFLISISQNMKNFTIETLPKMNDARSSHNVVHYGNFVFIVGGFNNQKLVCLSSCEKFNLSNKKWEKMASLKIQRSKPNLMEHKGKIYAFGGISSNQFIWDCQCERYNIEKDIWEGINYKGFDIPFVTGATPINKCWGFNETSNKYLVGGSNYQMSTYFFQDISFVDNSFKLNSMASEQRMNYSRQFPTLSLMKTDKQNQKILVIFGGVQQNVSLLSFDAIRLKFKQNQVNPFFVYDEINVGSYRLLLRQNARSAYSYMKNKLQQQGIQAKHILQSEQNEQSLLNSQQKLHLLQKMWYGVGKCLVGFSGS